MSDGAEAAVSLVAIVCTRDRPEQLSRCLGALAAALRPDDDRLVVDSASVDGAEVRRVAEEAGFRVVRAERPGLSIARNVGLRASTAELVAFTDDDCIVGDGWSTGIAAAFADDPRLGFVTGAVSSDRPSRLPIAVSAVDAPGRWFGPGDDPTGCGHGANMSFRASALADIGGFDPTLGAGSTLRAAEDTDVFWRLLDAGWRGRFEPTVAVTHAQWRSTTEALRTSYGYGVGLGALAAKGLRRRQPGARRLLRYGLWDNGLRQAFVNLRAGYQTGAASSSVRLAGVVVGAVRAARR